MFWSKLCKSNRNCAWNLAFISCNLSHLLYGICVNIFIESVYLQRATQRARILLTDNTKSGGSCSVNYKYLYLLYMRGKAFLACHEVVAKSDVRCVPQNLVWHTWRDHEASYPKGETESILPWTRLLNGSVGMNKTSHQRDKVRFYKIMTKVPAFYS